MQRPPKALRPTGSAGVPPARRSADGVQVSWRTRGYLPHLDAPNLVQHVIFRLADSLPPESGDEIDRMPTEDRVRAFDTALDRGHGTKYLAKATVAEVVHAALLAFHGKRYALLAWCIMPNHVHVLLQVKAGHPLDRVVHSWKSYTAKEANRLLGRSGTFWAREYFDRSIRNDGHLAWTVAYIEGNPVKAGLCTNIDDRLFSSASQREAGETPALPMAERA